MPNGAPSSFLFLVARPGAPSSIYATSRVFHAISRYPLFHVSKWSMMFNEIFIKPHPFRYDIPQVGWRIYEETQTNCSMLG